MTAIVPVVMILVTEPDLGPEGPLLQSLKPLVKLWAERKLDFGEVSNLCNLSKAIDTNSRVSKIVQVK